MDLKDPLKNDGAVPVPFTTEKETGTFNDALR